MAMAGGVIIALLGLLAAGALARGGPPPADAAPGTVGVSGAVLGAVAPAVAPGYRLQMTELVWAPGAFATSHSHPLTQIACVTTGALGMTLQQGTATVLRGGSGATPETAEALALDTEVVLGPRDCVAYDEFAAHTVHTVWNASDETTILWTADLVEIGKPYTTFVNARGTPVP
jgi:predicted metal-dependent enzyme (double-stranded beta helix superfamily)